MSAIEHPPDASSMANVYAGLRAVALTAGVLYAYITPQEQGSNDLIVAFAVFAAYGTIFYAVGYRTLGRDYGKGFYAALGGADLVFVVWLMHLTGAEASPFFRALYLWVAMPAFYFGFRTGSIASAVAVCVFGWFFPPGPGELWDFGAKAAGLVMHGPAIGYLVERDRRKTVALRKANAALERTVRRLEDARC